MTRSSPHRPLRHIAAWLACAALGAASPALQANQALAGKNGCMGCHAAATALVGPAYRDVAAKYAGQAGALQALTASIRQGGADRWGAIPMPPQPQLSESDARRLAAWILGGAR